MVPLGAPSSRYFPFLCIGFNRTKHIIAMYRKTFIINKPDYDICDGYGIHLGVASYITAYEWPVTVTKIHLMIQTFVK